MSEYTLSNSDLRFLFCLYKKGMYILRGIHENKERQRSYVRSRSHYLFGLHFTYDWTVTIPAYKRGELCLYYYIARE